MKNEMRIFALLLGLMGSVLGKDYYKILNLQENASTAEIKKSFRALARQFHPDKNSSEEAKQNFIDLQEAYDVLKSEESRRNYDLSRRRRRQGEGGGGGGGVPFHRRRGDSVKPFHFDMDDMFPGFPDFGDELFGGAFGGGFGKSLFDDFDDFFAGFGSAPNKAGGGRRRRRKRRSGSRKRSAIED